jgi:DNA ligase-1
MSEARAFVSIVATALDAARATTSRNAKIDAIAAALLQVSASGDDDLRAAVRLCMGEPFAPADDRTTGVGWRLVSAVLDATTGATDIREVARRLGDLGDAVGEILARREDERPGVTLAEVAELFDALANAPSRGHKAQLVTRLFQRATPLEAKYVTKTLLGEVRTGALLGTVLAAIAKAWNEDLDVARRAHAVVADAAETAVLARAGRLHDARIVVGSPVLPMLATPIEASKAPIDWEQVVVEDKLDGIRAQLHVGGGRVALFARGQGSIARAFPDVVRAIAGAAIDVVLDGEILAIAADGGPRPFQSLQARLGRTAPDAALLAEVPTAFVAYDALVIAGESLIEKPWSLRRAALDALARDVGLRVNPYESVASKEDLDAAFERARERGHEGLMLKRVDAPYEAGARGAAWLKVKRAAATLDVVVTAVEQGHGKRAGVLSDYTFAVRRGDELVDVGKAYSGLTDAEIAELGERFEKTTVETNGGWRSVTPTVVLEVAFDGVQRSTRHPSGFALRFPRIARIRDDKTPDEIDTIDAVERILASQVESGHREDAPPRAERTRAKKKEKTKASDRQLSLFDAPQKPKRD